MSKSFQLQLSSIMEIMTKTAMEEICKLVDGDFAFLRQELSRVMSENTVLKDQMLCLESEVESTRVTKEETRAGSKIYRSICVQTEYGVQPSIKGIFGKEWCSSLWDHQIEPREDTLAIDDDLYPVSPYKHRDQDCSNQLFIKEENLEVDTYANYIGKIPQVSRGQLHSSVFEPFAVNRPEMTESNKFNKRFVLDGFPEMSEIQTTSSNSSDKHSIEITVIDETGEQLMAPIDDSVESDGYYILDEFSDPGPSEAQNDGRSQEIYGYDATSTESCVKRFKDLQCVMAGRRKIYSAREVIEYICLPDGALSDTESIPDDKIADPDFEESPEAYESDSSFDDDKPVAAIPKANLNHLDVEIHNIHADSDTEVPDDNEPQPGPAPVNKEFSWRQRKPQQLT
ncbi:uncharacterized protein LOC127652290 [Xyrauchen texanus]|uniref:uncharacterized protein LOC127652290 n=1 Tax=Xyrauchen texanus TaxID=154827 RepID=UPI0022428EB7|nr:uncharacterized protein LOC127652290 [Xyrauchen texanus]